MKATPSAPTRYVTSFVDLDGPPRVLDLVDGRNATDVGVWLDARGPDWRAQIEVCALDPHRGYYNDVTARLDLAIRSANARLSSWSRACPDARLSG